MYLETGACDQIVIFEFVCKLIAQLYNWRFLHILRLLTIVKCVMCNIILNCEMFLLKISLN